MLPLAAARLFPYGAAVRFRLPGTAMMLLLLLPGVLAAVAAAEYAAPPGLMPPTNPPWEPTWDLARSTITMTCNGSGWSDPALGAQFGIVSYDWSNAKTQWAAAKPMDCEKRLQTQARMTKAANNETHVFGYRNVVKALPWFGSVREKLDDPAYSGWFLRFDPEQVASKNTSVPPCAAEDQQKCSVYYHDQEQTPEVPVMKNGTMTHPDGSCDGQCDCGSQPCGEYLFDHRNGTMLRDWIVKEHILGPAGMGDPAISGFFIDDFWCSDLLSPGACHDPVQGATEIDAHQQVDMGLSDADIKDLTLGWEQTMGAVQKAIVDAGGYTWSLVPGQENANASPILMTNSTCADQLRKACTATSRWSKFATFFGLTVLNDNTLIQLEQDIAFFLLARGPFAWLGWGRWGIGWPFNPEPAHGTLPAQPHGVPLPAILQTEVGEPSGLCVEKSEGVFEREYSKVSVRLDCGKFEAEIKPK